MPSFSMPSFSVPRESDLGGRRRAANFFGIYAQHSPPRLTRPPRQLPQKSERDDNQDKDHVHPGSLFLEKILALPFELQAVVIQSLSFNDLLSLRLSSPSLSALVINHAATIARQVLPKLLSNYKHLELLYPIPSPADLHSALHISRKMQKVEKFTDCLIDWIEKDIYMVHKTRTQEFFKARKDLANELRGPLSVLFHYFEQLVKSAAAVPETETDAAAIVKFVRAKLSGIIASYPIESLLRTIQTMRSVVIMFRQRTRPPSYASLLERRIRGWDHEPATEKELYETLFFGNLGFSRLVCEQRTLKLRLVAIRLFVDKLHHATEHEKALSLSHQVGEPSLPREQVLDVIGGRLPFFFETFTMQARRRLSQAGLPAGLPYDNAFAFIPQIVHQSYGPQDTRGIRRMMFGAQAAGNAAAQATLIANSAENDTAASVAAAHMAMNVAINIVDASAASAAVDAGMIAVDNALHGLVLAAPGS